MKGGPLSLLTPDPLGYRDSSNLYAFAGGDPVNHRDPTGMYQADVHFGLTYYLALKAGFSPAQARVIATGAETPDQDPERDPIKTTVRALGDEGLGSLLDIDSRSRGEGSGGKLAKAQAAELRARLRSDHFPRADDDPTVVSPFSQESQQRVKTAMQNGQLFAFGEGLHTLQDSESHRGLPSLFDISGHPKERGGWTSTETDVPSNYPRQALDAAQATYSYLVTFKNKREKATIAKQPEWGAIQDDVKQFIALTERAWLQARGVTMPDKYWDDVSMGPKEETLRKGQIDPKVLAETMAKAQAQCHCAPGF